jgi:hypothetical protein
MYKGCTLFPFHRTASFGTPSSFGSYFSCSNVMSQIWLFHPLAEGLGMSTWQVPFPTWMETVLQVAFFFVYEDMFHFFGMQTLVFFVHQPRIVYIYAFGSPSIPPLGSHV